MNIKTMNKLFKKFSVCSCGGGVYKEGLADGLNIAEKYYKKKEVKRKFDTYLTFKHKKQVELKDVDDDLKCHKCNKPFKNAVDSKTKLVSQFLWKPTCKCKKGFLISRG